MKDHRSGTADREASSGGNAEGLQHAMRALGRGEPATARRLLARILALDPECAQAHYYMGIAMHMEGMPGAAIDAFRHACELAPMDPAVRMGLGIALHDHGEHQAGIAELERACQLGPDVPAYWFNLGKALLSSEPHPARALAALNRVLALDGGHLLAHMALADAHILLGDIDAAAGHYREVLRRQPSHAKAWLGLADIKTQPLTPRDATDIEQAWHKAPVGSDARIALGFALAKAQEDQGDYLAAFTTLQKANAAKRATIDWDAGAEHAYVDRIMRAFAGPSAEASDHHRGEGVVFILSLPRSGSTLIEQILASHPDFDAAGEITDLQRILDAESRQRRKTFPEWVGEASEADWARLGRDYMDATRAYRQDGKRVTDKNLLNWKLAGAAHAMLPGARFVHVQRDPVETCFACFRQLFRSGNPFSYELAEMAGYWKDCERLCRMWSGLFPESWHEVIYERLLAEPEQEIHRLLDFCGVPDDPACLAFHRTPRVVRTASAAQVRQPLRRDTARALLYGDALDPLRAMLEREKQQLLSGSIHAGPVQ